MSEVIVEVLGRVGCLTLNRPRALNALSLSMVRSLSAPFGAFCAGGDLCFFHQTISAGGPELEDFFTEEYQLNHLIHTYPKPYIAFMDGIVMGGWYGHQPRGHLRIVTERTKMAMPETRVGLFPDVGGGYFLSRCAGRMGEYLGLTGRMLSGAEVFALPTVGEIIQALEADTSDWAQASAKSLRELSPLMLAVSLEQIRRARSMRLADELRMERSMVRHCFNPVHLGRSGLKSETMEGIRALAVDKDHHPQWSPSLIEDVTPEMVEGFFVSPWPAQAHPLRDLG
jgi:enoyl-CoA hydratase/carnithine racemase